VKLSEGDGNAFTIMGKAASALRKSNYSKDQIEAYRKEAMGGDYDHLLQVTMKWCEVS
jgi:hypothetical protein